LWELFSGRMLAIYWNMFCPRFCLMFCSKY